MNFGTRGGRNYRTDSGAMMNVGIGDTVTDWWLYDKLS